MSVWCLVASWTAMPVQAEDLIYLEHSNTLEFDEARLPDAQILRGDVLFRHDSMWLYCDSAYFYDKRNSLDAFGHVRIVQGDTLFGYGDKLFYNGNTKLARFRKHVKLIHRSTILTTDSMNYDRKRDVAYYLWGGKIVDSLNTLTSVRGHYYPPTKQSIFRRNVHLKNDRFTLEADTLKYNTESHIADIVGPTTIVYEEETTILSSNGTYNTQSEQSLLYDRSVVRHNDHKMMIGDTLFYDKQVGYGIGWSNVIASDTTNQMTLYGNYCEMYEDPEHGFATDSALLIDWSDSVDYVYMHADTLFTETIDSAKHVRAHHNVRIYKTDMQAVCDSMRYDGKDSIVHLYTNPVCWSDSNQVAADTVHIFLKNEDVDYMHGVGAGIMIQQITDEYFNQMSGKEIFAYVREGEIREVEVKGNALTVYYPIDDNGKFVGLNTTESSTINMYLVNQNVEHVLFKTETSGTIYPLDQVPEGSDFLNAFFWAVEERPLVPGDVFLNPQRTPRVRQTTIKIQTQ